ncbi:hypothetical protein L1N85_00785 [Paenibacillus alkaliterrae]|uniref:S16 family serine protease n=1 Tax=Paenibacillus alkaliterrae TaxID=320909 RepID=UPI001F2B9080|nr:S16 family serine protease [Paenibacillus alkaliterrae]MCF2936964.1 hypothetical protein [Paenibacillus alkaliterrae]
MPLKRSDLRRIVFIAVSAAVSMWVLLYAPTPYVIYEPGLAVPVKPMIAAQKGDSPGEGAFLLTAIKLTEPNFLQTISSMWSPRKDVHLKRDVLRGYTRQQYAERLNVIMQGSQNNAIEAAYRYIGIPYESKSQAIIVSDIQAQRLNAVLPFEAGDKLIGIKGGERFGSIPEAFDILKRLDAKQESAFEVERRGEMVSVPFFAGAFHSSLSAEQMLQALGVTGLTELRGLEPADSRNRLTIEAGDIGGPSAGLVFALQALDLLTAGDLTGGHRIAATGTITVDGKVGAIGGIEQKIVIASEEGAQLFLAPARNFEEAQAKAKSLGTSMKVVSVATLQDAMDHVEAFNAASPK